MILEMSRDGNAVGQNISYDNSFTKVKGEILKETIQKQKQNNYQVEDVIIEKPPKTKPKTQPKALLKPQA